MTVSSYYPQFAHTYDLLMSSYTTNSTNKHETREAFFTDGDLQTDRHGGATVLYSLEMNDCLVLSCLVLSDASLSEHFHKNRLQTEYTPASADSISGWLKRVVCLLRKE